MTHSSLRGHSLRLLASGALTFALAWAGASAARAEGAAASPAAAPMAQVAQTAQKPGQPPAPLGAAPTDPLSGFAAPLPGAAPDAPAAPAPSGAAAPTAPKDAESGFSAALPLKPPPGSEPGEEKAPPLARLNGFLRLDGSYNTAHQAPAPGATDFRGLSKLRSAVQLELALQMGADWKAFLSGQAFRDFVYQLRGEEHYTPQVLERYQQEAEVREAYVLGTPLRSLDIKIGRQIVVWGKSDNIRIVDVLNPLDLREPGLTDLEDLRLPVTMGKLSYYTGPWSLTGIAIPEIRFNKEPVPGSDFFPFPTLPPEEKPRNGDGNTEWAASLSGIFTGWDLAFYWADIFNVDATVADQDNNPGNGIQLVRRHARVHMSGAAANVALGNWLLKSELAYFTGLRFFNVPQKTFERLDGLIGAEYSVFTDTTLGFEASDRLLLQHEAALEQAPDLQPRDVNQYALSYRGTYLREKLDVVAVLSAFGRKADQGTLQRYQLTYELARALHLTGGVVIYTAGKGGNFLLLNARDDDRVFFSLKWSF